jgi:hypothetical protein
VMLEKIKGQKIIINTDLDGLLSGLILQHFLDCEIVGFSNSRDKIFYNPQRCHDIFDCIFIDMYIPNPQTITIDQHVIATDDEHLTMLKNYGTKINPNLFAKRCFLTENAYYKKFPLATVHFLIGLLERWQIDLSSIILKRADAELSPIDFLLRADDVMNITVNTYRENAINWWQYMLSISNNGFIINQLVDYLQTINKTKAIFLKEKTSRFLVDTFRCESPDGGFKNILDENFFIKKNIKTYFDFLAQHFGLKTIDNNMRFETLSGINKRVKFDYQKHASLVQNGTIAGEKVFSYAFVRAQQSDANFSYTVLSDITK